MTQANTTLLTNMKDVLYLFLIPIGGGIPAGVILAQKRALTWPIMVFLYAISDIVLAVCFEPVMLLFIRASKRSEKVMKFHKILSDATKKTTSRYGLNPRPLSLVMITFGTDPMTGRAVSKAAGHGFFAGWFLTILGDLLYFTVLMVSTLWLSSIVGDGTWVVVIMVVAMLVIPALIDHLRGKPKGNIVDKDLQP